MQWAIKATFYFSFYYASKTSYCKSCLGKRVKAHLLNNAAHSESETLLQELQLKTEGGDQKSPEAKTLEVDNYCFNGVEEQATKFLLGYFWGKFPRCTEQSTLLKRKSTHVISWCSLNSLVSWFWGWFKFHLTAATHMVDRTNTDFSVFFLFCTSVCHTYQAAWDCFRLCSTALTNGRGVSVCYGVVLWCRSEP